MLSNYFVKDYTNDGVNTWEHVEYIYYINQLYN